MVPLPILIHKMYLIEAFSSNVSQLQNQIYNQCLEYILSSELIRINN